MEAQHICVPFHQEGFVFLDDFLLGLVQSVQHLTLVVDRILRRIKVFRRLYIILENTTAKPKDTPRNTVNRKHHTSAESIIPTAVAIHGNPTILKCLLVVLRFNCVLCKGVRLLWTIAQLKLSNSLIRKPALLKITQANRATFIAMVQLFLKPFVGNLRNKIHRFTVIARFNFLGRLRTLFGHLNIVFIGQPSKRLRISHLFQFHEERYHRTALTRAKIFEDLLDRAYHETRGLLVIKRTQTLQVTPRFLQLNELSDHLLNTSGRKDLFNSFLWDSGHSIARYILCTKKPPFWGGQAS